MGCVSVKYRYTWRRPLPLFPVSHDSFEDCISFQVEPLSLNQKSLEHECTAASAPKRAQRRLWGLVFFEITPVVQHGETIVAGDCWFCSFGPFCFLPCLTGGRKVIPPVIMGVNLHAALD